MDTTPAVAWTFGERLALLLWQKGVPRFEFADAIGVTRTAINKWVHNETQPRDRLKKPICDYFGVEEAVLWPNGNELPSPFKEVRYREGIFLTLESDNAQDAINAKDTRRIAEILNRKATGKRFPGKPYPMGPLVRIPDAEFWEAKLAETVEDLSAVIDWLVARGLGHSDDRDFIRPTGYEMAPTLTPDHCVIVERCSAVTTPGIYLIDHYGQHVFRRIMPQGGRFNVLCDNQRYPSQTVENLTVLGRAVRVLSDSPIE